MRKTIGIVEVAALAANADAVLPSTTRRSTSCRTSSLASADN
jgi:hypothetical protein